jgi:hypothetical protein
VLVIFISEEVNVMLIDRFIHHNVHSFKIKLRPRLFRWN